MVQDEAEQLRLEGGVGRVDQALQLLAARRHDLVAEDHQGVTQDGEGLGNKQAERLSNPTREGKQAPEGVLFSLETDRDISGIDLGGPHGDGSPKAGTCEDPPAL